MLLDPISRTMPHHNPRRLGIEKITVWENCAFHKIPFQRSEAQNVITRRSSQCQHFITIVCQLQCNTHKYL